VVILRLLVLLSLFSLVLATSTPDVNESNLEKLFITVETSIANFLQELFQYFHLCEHDTNLSAEVVKWSGLVMVISFMLYLLFYLLGKMLNVPNISAFLHTEMYTLFTNLVLILVVVAVVYVMDSLEIFQKANEYLLKVLIKNSVFQVYLLSYHQIVMLYSRVTIPLNPVATAYWFSVQTNFTQVIKLILSLIGYILNASAFLSIQYIFKLFLLCLSGKFFMKILFPLGLLLRSFYPTRGGGNALLGIALAFYVVYPIILYIMAGLYDNAIGIWVDYLVQSFYDIIRTGVLYISTLMLKLLESWLFTYMIGLADDINAILETALRSIGIALSTIRTGMLLGSAMNLISAFLNLFFGYGLFIVLFGFIISPITIFITLIASGEISERLGTKINLAAFTRLI